MHSSKTGMSEQLHRTHKHNYTPQPLMSVTTHPRYRSLNRQPTLPRISATSRHPHRDTHYNQQHTHSLTQPPDPETRQASKQYFKLLQATHHRQIIDKAIATQTFPPGMMRQVNRLTDFIKPAAPTEHTRTKVANNTTHWMHTNMTILQEHYLATIATLNTIPENPLALQIAIGWAKKRYGHRITPETIHTVQHTLGIHHQ